MEDGGVTTDTDTFYTDDDFVSSYDFLTDDDLVSSYDFEQEELLPSLSGAVEVGTKTEVGVTASGHDDRPGGSAGMNGCGAEGGDGCEAALTRDGIVSEVESRWSCATKLVEGGGPCQIEFTFAEPQDIVDIEIAFWKGDERIRTMDVSERNTYMCSGRGWTYRCSRPTSKSLERTDPMARRIVDMAG